MEKTYAGLILAAGYSSRMGDLKALLPIGGEALIERQIKCFLSAGISDIFIVVGHRADDILRTVGRYPVRTVYNERYPDGMFTSVQAGVRAVSGGIYDGVFLLPVDYALAQPFTLGALAERFGKGGVRIVYPCYNNKKGHPPLFDASLTREILASAPDAGLKSVLERHKSEAEYLGMGNATCLVDIDSQEDYKKALEYLEEHYAPDMNECEYIHKYYNVPEQVAAHCKSVARNAKIIADALKDKGYDIDPDLIFRSALVHDVRKGMRDHAGQGARALASMGYPKAATLIANHMDIGDEYASVICNVSVLYLADKITDKTKTVGISQRLASLSGQSGGTDDERIRNARARMQKAAHIQRMVESALGVPAMQLLRENEHDDE